MRTPITVTGTKGSNHTKGGYCTAAFMAKRGARTTVTTAPMANALRDIVDISNLGMNDITTMAKKSTPVTARTDSSADQDITASLFRHRDGAPSRRSSLSVPHFGRPVNPPFMGTPERGTCQR